MRTGKDITHIFIHCTAGYGDVKAIRKYWRSLKWKTDGYHKLIDLDGSIYNLVDFQNASNGVAGFNSKAIHISYIGGVDKKNYNKAVDSRTPEQKEALLIAIEDAIQWVHAYGGNIKKLKILGHRDISPDKNLNGIVDSNERIKECPSFDAIPEYKHLLN